MAQSVQDGVANLAKAQQDQINNQGIDCNAASGGNGGGNGGGNAGGNAGGGAKGVTECTTKIGGVETVCGGGDCKVLISSKSFKTCNAFCESVGQYCTAVS